MARRALVPRGFEAAAERMALSPGIVSAGHVFLTGITGSRPDGAMPADPEAQFRSAFDKIGAVLGEAGLSCAAIVEMTSYHIGLRAHFDLFVAVRAEYVSAPYPAWTAVEVAGLRREGAIVEIRVVAVLEGG
ncbi:MAG: RidA family protein [Pseudomonadota bacterium]